MGKDSGCIPNTVGIRVKAAGVKEGHPPSQGNGMSTAKLTIFSNEE